ncbi:MAG TPA: hypothetical protein VHC86_08835 [Opitutaceae bacterium]|nr:hypothetical protein [Opitutaceae bacterium]
MPLSRRNHPSWWLQAALLLGIGWFYFWTAVPEWRPGLLRDSGRGYYGLLTRGFLHGHLYLDLPADPFLATLSNPSDPIARQGHGLHDASYYRGHYYLYFGVTPVVVLFIPYRLLTGHFLDESLASPAFAAAGLAVAALLFRDIRRRFYPGATSAVAVVGIAAVGLAAMIPDLLRRSSVWEVPITCGFLCCLVALWAVFRALTVDRPAPWLALASAAFGLAVGCRPDYLFGCPALLVPFFMRARRTPFPARWTLITATLLPISAVGVGLALYNWGRFGSPLDFGFRHLMNGEQVASERLFSWPFLAYNLRAYWLLPAGWSRYFPFVEMAKLPPAPPGHLGAEDPYGILPNMPFILLVLAIAGLWHRPAEGRGGLRAFCVAVALAAAGSGLAVTAFGGAINRYMVDFLPAAMMLAGIGFLEADARWAGWGSGGRLARVGALALLGYSAIFNIFASIRHNELFRADHPAVYRRIAHRWDWLPDLYDRWRGTRYGPIEMKVEFPADKAGAIEPLVATGRSFLSDYLFVHYLGADSIQFGLEHTSRGTFLGPPVGLDSARPHVLRIDLGSLYPPAADPYFDRMPPDEARRRQRTLRVTLDGRVALDRELVFYDASGPVPSVGSAGDRPAFPQGFSGRILSWRRLAGAALPASPQRFGALRLEAVLPPFGGIRNEPLVCSGETGRGDLIYLRYLAPGRISFGYDHWGSGGPITPPVETEPRARQVIEIDYGGLHPREDIEESASASTSIVVRLNGRLVLNAPVPYYPCDPGTVSVGLNAIQASTASPTFSGSLLKVERLPGR